MQIYLFFVLKILCMLLTEGKNCEKIEVQIIFQKRGWSYENQQN